MSLQHVVLFRFPRELTTAEDTRLRAMVASFREKIGLMTRCRLGTDITGARNRGYSYLLFTEFPGREALIAYQDHPVHEEFVTYLGELECSSLAFDYALDAQTVLMPE